MYLYNLYIAFGGLKFVLVDTVKFEHWNRVLEAVVVDSFYCEADFLCD